MKTWTIAFCLLMAGFCASGSNLPTVTVEHLYFLATRGEHVKALRGEELVQYCVAQKLGNSTFESLNDQLLTMRIELTTLIVLQELREDDPRVVALKKKRSAFESLLQEEARKIQQGVVREGVIADETLRAIARAQNGGR
jgi:hypothetical protein